MTSEASYFSSLVSLSQAPPLVPSYLSPSSPCAPALPVVPSSSFPFMPPIPPLCPQVPYSNSLAKLPLFAETLHNAFAFEFIKTRHFKIKSSEDPEAKP